MKELLEGRTHHDLNPWFREHAPEVLFFLFLLLFIVPGFLKVHAENSAGRPRVIHKAEYNGSPSLTGLHQVPGNRGRKALSDGETSGAGPGGRVRE